MKVTMRDHKLDGAALMRIARELRETLTTDCEACRRGIPRQQVWGTDEDPKYTHHYGGEPGTVAPCMCEVPTSVFDDLDRVEGVGLWLFWTQPIVFPISNLPLYGRAAGPGDATGLIPANADGVFTFPITATG